MEETVQKIHQTTTDKIVEETQANNNDTTTGRHTTETTTTATTKIGMITQIKRNSITEERLINIDISASNQDNTLCSNKHRTTLWKCWTH